MDHDILYENTSTIPCQSGNVITTIDIWHEMSFEMDIFVHSIPTGWTNIFHCGSNDDLRQPSIYLNAQTNFAGFYAPFTTNSNSNYGVQSGAAIIANTSYHLEFVIQRDWMTVYQDGIPIFDGSKGEHTLNQNLPCYVSNPWRSAGL